MLNFHQFKMESGTHWYRARFLYLKLGPWPWKFLRFEGLEAGAFIYDYFYDVDKAAWIPWLATYITDIPWRDVWCKGSDPCLMMFDACSTCSLGWRPYPPLKFLDQLDMKKLWTFLALSLFPIWNFHRRLIIVDYFHQFSQSLYARWCRQLTQFDWCMPSRNSAHTLDELINSFR